MKTILISCYAVSPYKGSEDATGWNIVLQIIKYYKVILITRKNNIPDISNYIRNSSNEYFENLEFYGYDLWKPICDLKKKLSGKSHVVYYHLWQYNIVSFIRSSGFTSMNRSVMLRLLGTNPSLVHGI